MGLDWKIERDLEPYIETHLLYELKYLLVAATTWSAVHNEAAGEQWPHHLGVVAMESAFVHTRTLCEFLNLEEGWGKGPRSPHRAPSLPLWHQYSGPMHMKVLHPDPRRPYMIGVQEGDDLKERVVDFAREVLLAWDAVTDQPEMTAFRTPMLTVRQFAVADGRSSATRMSVQPVFK